MFVESSSDDDTGDVSPRDYDEIISNSVNNAIRPNDGTYQRIPISARSGGSGGGRPAILSSQSLTYSDGDNNEMYQDGGDD
jgi:hypothetical protein